MASKPSMIPLGKLASDEKGAVTIGPFGSRMKAEVYVASGVPVIRGTNISNGRWLKGDWVFVSEDFARGLPNCLLKPGDLVFPHRGSIGEVAIIEENHGTMLLSSSMMKFRPDASRIDSGFLFYYFRSHQGRSEILKFSSQVGTPGIGQPLTSLRQFNVPLMPLPRQKAIARILGTLDEKIELNRRMNETLEGMARAIFKSWFVDFDPVRAKMDGQQPPGMDADTAALFPDSLEHGNGNLIPDGWRTGCIRDLCRKVENGGTPKRQVEEYWNPTAVPWLTSGEVRQGFIVGTENFISNSGLANSSAKLWPPFATVIALYGATAGHASLLGMELCANQACCALIPHANSACSNFLAVSSSLSHFQQQTRGSAQQNLSQSLVADLPIVIPPDRLLAAFEKSIRPILERCICNISESSQLASVRDLLLPKLLSGQLPVGNAEAIIEATT